MNCLCFLLGLNSSNVPLNITNTGMISNLPSHMSNVRVNFTIMGISGPVTPELNPLLPHADITSNKLSNPLYPFAIRIIQLIKISVAAITM